MKSGSGTGGVPDVIQDKSHAVSSERNWPSMRAGCAAARFGSHCIGCQGTSIQRFLVTLRSQLGLERKDCPDSGRSAFRDGEVIGVSSISQQNPVKIFVAHAFVPDEDYQRVFEYLESSHNFFYVNCSVPDYRGDMNGEAPKNELRRQISLSEVVVIPSSLFGRYRDLINFQVNCAKGLEKPVIVLEAFGVKEKMPVQLEALGDEIVDWNERSLVDAIRRQARHEDTTRWDVVEFKLD